MDMARISNLKVLITGASGFIGCHLSAALLRNGNEVHATSRMIRVDQEMHWWHDDLRDAAKTKQIVSLVQPDIIFHLAGHVSASPASDLVLSTFGSHVASTVHLLTAATELGCKRVVLTGSLTEPQGNASSCIPSSPYAAAKWASSAYGRMFHQLYDLPVTIVRPFMTYGPMQNISKVIPYVILALLRGETPQLASGRWEADWIYIDDVVDGMLAAAAAPESKGCTIDLGSGVLVSVRRVIDELVDLVAAAKKPVFGALQDRPAEERRIADLKYALEKTGWKPLVSLSEGLARTVEWYRARFDTTDRSDNQMGSIQ
jgi:nucleoside-diphosphate-sugar epimerase